MLLSKELLNLSAGRALVYDNIVPRELYQELLQTSLDLEWQFGWKTMSNPNMRYWHHEVGYGLKENIDDISEQVEKHPLRVFTLYQTWLKNYFLSPEAKVLRFYLNAHTYGTEGWPHTDSDRSGELTTVLYLNQQWRPEWGGETVVFDEAGNIASSTMPAPNRLLVFPSDRLHAPRPVSKAFDDLRIVLVVKLAVAHTLDHDIPESERAHLNFLAGAGSADIAHSGRDLLTHLLGTWRILRQRGADPDVCLAGMFHSVYGTSVMRCTLPLDRLTIRSRIGERAERLAWLFCMLDRPACWTATGPDFPAKNGQRLLVDLQDWQDLRVIEQANLDEQGILSNSRLNGLSN